VPQVFIETMKMQSRKMKSSLLGWAFHDKVGAKNPFSKCGEQKPFFKKPSILLIPQQQLLCKYYLLDTDSSLLTLLIPSKLIWC
jgi:hypothetical protein